jgi:hypothetical protein
MFKERAFRAVFVSSGHGTGAASEENPDDVIHYTGKAVAVVCKPQTAP